MYKVINFESSSWTYPIEAAIDNGEIECIKVLCNVNYNQNCLDIEKGFDWIASKSDTSLYKDIMLVLCQYGSLALLMRPECHDSRKKLRIFKAKIRMFVYF